MLKGLRGCISELTHSLRAPTKSEVTFFMFKSALAAGDCFLLMQRLEGQVHEHQAFPKAVFLEGFRGRSLGNWHGLAQ